MLFDANVQALDIRVIAPEEDDTESDTLQLAIMVGSVLPIATGPGAPPIPLPLGMQRFPLDRDSAIALGRELIERGEALPKPSNLVTAQSLAGIDRVADFQKGLRNE